MHEIIKKYLLAALACLLGVACFFSLQGLHRRVNTLEADLSALRNGLPAQINRIPSQIESALTQQASLLADSGWQYGAPDVASHTVPLELWVVPKSYVAGQTAATLVCNGESLPMAFSNDRFVVTVTLPLFDPQESLVTHVTFAEGDARRTEAFLHSFYPRYELLPTVYALFAGTVREQPSDRAGFCAVTSEGYIQIDASAAEAFEVRSADVVLQVDGAALARTPLAINMQSTWELGDNIAFTLAADVPAGKTAQLELELTDGYGFVHRRLLQTFSVTAESRLLTPLPPGEGYGEASLYDPQGNEIVPVY